MRLAKKLLLTLFYRKGRLNQERQSMLPMVIQLKWQSWKSKSGFQILSPRLCLPLCQWNASQKLPLFSAAEGQPHQAGPHSSQREATEEPHQVHQTAKTIIAVKEFQHSPEGEADWEKHGSVAAAWGMRTFHQPQGVVHHVRQNVVGMHANLQRVKIKQFFKTWGKGTFRRYKKFTSVCRYLQNTIIIPE